MSADELNNILKRDHPAAWRCLSPLGKRLYFPLGVPVQAAQARDCEFNTTIGQFTDAAGAAMPLPSMSSCIQNLSNEDVFLYTPQGGRKDLRSLWQRKIIDETGLVASLPVLCAGLTHGLGLAADLFVDEDTTVILPGPRWSNYDLVFGIRAKGNIVTYQSMAGSSSNHSEWSFNVSGLTEAIKSVSGKALLLLNFPSNPGGYSPTLSEVEAIIGAIKESKGPLVVVLDEAYKGMEWEDNILKSSLFGALADLDQERFLVMKIDGATKEMFFFGGRIGFVSFISKASEVLEEKTIAAIRSVVSALPSPSQALVTAALTSPTLDQEISEIRGILKQRYSVLKETLKGSTLDAWPFNSAFFAMIHTPGGAENTRLKLLDVGVGTVAVPSVNAIRISYSTVSANDIPEMIKRIETTLK
jgi:aspartate/methionine/tyrosine aminotransferase